MSAPNMPTPKQVSAMLDLFRDRGLPIGRVRIAPDAIEIYPPAESPREASPFDNWISENDGEGRSASRQ